MLAPPSPPCAPPSPPRTQVNGSSVDLLILEYTQNSLTQDIWRPDQAYGAEERQALERIFRRALGMTSRPAVVMLHSYTSKFAGVRAKAGVEGRGVRAGRGLRKGVWGESGGAEGSE